MIQSKMLQMLCKAATENDLQSAAALLQSNPGMLEHFANINTDCEAADEGTARPYVELELGDSPLMRAIDNGDMNAPGSSPGSDAWPAPCRVFLQTPKEYHSMSGI